MGKPRESMAQRQIGLGAWAPPPAARKATQESLFDLGPRAAKAASGSSKAEAPTSGRRQLGLDVEAQRELCAFCGHADAHGRAGCVKILAGGKFCPCRAKG
ncbi:MAG: hypothetical protein ACHP7H_00655 [Hyphomicrobiales bacterium]